VPKLGVISSSAYYESDLFLPDGGRGAGQVYRYGAVGGRFCWLIFYDDILGGGCLSLVIEG